MIESRVCKSCGEEKYVIIDFRAKSKPNTCRSCLVAKDRECRRKRTGCDPKNKWGTFKFGLYSRKDPRDAILDV